MGNDTLFKYEENNVKIFGFWHIFTINNWKEIVMEQKAKIKKSKLSESSSQIFVSVAGDVGSVLNSLPNATIITPKNEDVFGELPAIKFLHEFCSREEECFVWYIHAKGVTRPENKCVSDWRRCLEYFMICQWRLCEQGLFENDVSGALWNGNHFHGNFWWARSSYIRKCKSIEINQNRHQAEFFLGTGNPKVKNLHETNINHYQTRYGYGNFVKIF